jgi:hypothetical protein
MTFETRVLTITVAQPVGVVSAYLADPRNYPQWASGLAGGLSSLAGKSSEDADPHLWSTRTPQGEVTIRFTAANDFGVADHWVYLPDGTTVYVPLRAVANDSGAEVSFTLFRLPSMSAEQFEQDAAWVLRDLQALKAALGSGTASG